MIKKIKSKVKENSPILYGQDKSRAKVEVVTHSRELHMYQVTANEIAAIQELGHNFSIWLAFFALLIGIFFTLIITLTTVSIPSPSIFAAYVLVAVGSLIGTIFFAVRAIIDYKNGKEKIKLIIGDE